MKELTAQTKLLMYTPGEVFGTYAPKYARDLLSCYYSANLTLDVVFNAVTRLPPRLEPVERCRRLFEAARSAIHADLLGWGFADPPTEPFYSITYRRWYLDRVARDLTLHQTLRRTLRRACCEIGTATSCVRAMDDLRDVVPRDQWQDHFERTLEAYCR